MRLSVNIDQIATLRKRAGRAAERSSGRARVRRWRARRASPSTCAATRGTSGRRRARPSRPCSRRRRARDRIQHRRGSPPDLHRPGARGAAGPVHARAGAAAGADDQAGWPPRRRAAELAGGRRGSCRRAASASASSSIPTRRRSRWAAAVGADRIEINTGRSRALRRRARRRPSGASRATSRRRAWRHALGLEVIAGHGLELRQRHRRSSAAAAYRRSVDRARLVSARAVRRDGPGRPRHGGVLVAGT